MNHITVIGNLVRDPELRTVGTGSVVCNFVVAVNRRRSNNGQQETDYFRITCWNAVAENCSKFLSKGNKVAVSGTVSASAYLDKDKQARATLEINASEIEFLTPKNNSQNYQSQSSMDEISDANDYTETDVADLPF